MRVLSMTTAPLPPMTKETKAGRTVVGAQARTSVLKGDAGCPGKQATNVDHSTQRPAPSQGSSQSLRCRGGDTDMSEMAEWMAGPAEGHPWKKAGPGLALQHPGTGGHSWEGVQCGPNNNVSSQSQYWHGRPRQGQPGSRLVLPRLNHSQDGDWLSVSLGTSPSRPAVASCSRDTADRCVGGSAHRPQTTTAQGRWAQGQAQHEGPGQSARGAGAVLRPPGEPRPPCGRIAPVRRSAPRLSLRLACLDGQQAEPGVPPAVTQARKSYQKSNEFTKIENNYSRAAGAAASRGGAGPKRGPGDRVLQQAQWALPHHHIPQAAHEARAVGLGQGLAHGQLLQASCRTNTGKPPAVVRDGRAGTLVGRESHQRLNDEVS